MINRKNEVVSQTCAGVKYLMDKNKIDVYIGTSTVITDQTQYQRKLTSLAVVDGVTTPSTEAGWAQIYVDTADGDLKVKFGDGTVKTIVTD